MTMLQVSDSKNEVIMLKDWRCIFHIDGVWNIHGLHITTDIQQFSYNFR